MCLILFSYKQHPVYPLVLAANRDEFYDRPSAPVSVWSDYPEVLAGQDLREGGTWLGITRKGRIAALTNYRDPASFKENAPSRGWVVRDFLTGSEETAGYLQELLAKAHDYNGFNLIVGEWPSLYCFSNRNGLKELSPGLYGLSNHLLNTSWPKVELGRAALGALLENENKPSASQIFEILADKSKPEDHCLPETGIGLEWERILSPVFINSPSYGTRSSTVLMIDQKGHVMMSERLFNGHRDPWMTAQFRFRIRTV